MHLVKQSCTGAGVAPDDDDDDDEDDDDVVVVVDPPLDEDEEEEDAAPPVCEELDCFVFEDDDGVSSTSSSSSLMSFSFVDEPSDDDGGGGGVHPVPVSITAPINTMNAAVTSAAGCKEYSERFDIGSWPIPSCRQEDQLQSLDQLGYFARSLTISRP